MSIDKQLVRCHVENQVQSILIHHSDNNGDVSRGISVCGTDVAEAVINSPEGIAFIARFKMESQRRLGKSISIFSSGCLFIIIIISGTLMAAVPVVPAVAVLPAVAVVHEDEDLSESEEAVHAANVVEYYSSPNQSFDDPIPSTSGQKGSIIMPPAISSPDHPLMVEQNLLSTSQSSTTFLGK